MRARLSALSLILFAAACGGGGPAAPPGLAYGLPSVTQVSYVQGDTTHMDIDAGGQSLQVKVTSSTTFGTGFARAADGGVQVTMTVEDLSARMSQPMGPPVTVDEEGIEGELVFTLDRTGHATVESEPEVKGPAAQFFGGLALANSFFPRLPGRAVGAGDTWSDTIRFSGPQGEGKVSSVIAADYTAVGDTTVDGKRLLKITWEGKMESDATGVTAGMDFAQNVKGDVGGTILWDLSAGLMYASDTEVDARGSMEVSAAPFPMAIRMKQVSHVRIAN